ncbi:MAG TPA: GNAT family N-acetyltransferase [Bryobacteraceae bacterium]|jgi:ribosomal protein S18 acetylase RimI-like enzyme
MSLTLRPATPQDDQFVYDLIYRNLAETLHADTWDERIRHPLLDLQVRAKHGSYAVSHPNAEYAIIQLDDKPIGRLIIDRSGAFYDLVDIAILAKHRSAGIGSRLILAICTEAGMMKKNVRLYVSAGNPRAAALYRRLGFRVVEDRQSDLLMERAPGDPSQLVASP